jgi:hypothetical protein
MESGITQKKVLEKDLKKKGIHEIYLEIIINLLVLSSCYRCFYAKSGF